MIVASRMQRFQRSSGRTAAASRRGLSLLEVILSIAILGGAMVMIGQLYYLGYRSALQTRYRSEGNLYADAKMAELASGVLPLESGGGVVEGCDLDEVGIGGQQSGLVIRRGTRTYEGLAAAAAHQEEPAAS